MKKRMVGFLTFLMMLAMVIGLTLRNGFARPVPQQTGQSTAARSFDPQNLTGFWVLSVDSRMIPPAELLPTVSTAEIDQHLEADRRIIRYCDDLGTPEVMDPGVPIDIVQGHREIIILAAVPAAPRHIYLERADHINPEIFDPTSNGDSIGHWDGDTLVVDTIGFSATRGITSIPGGGFKTIHSHLVEQYQLLENGGMLAVKFTWTDPTVYKTPHSYEFHYYRVVGDYQPSPLPCNAYDDARTEFLGFKPGPAVKLSSVPGAKGAGGNQYVPGAKGTGGNQ